MEAREFWGRDMNEALQAVRESLGADALILETLSVPSAEGAERGERIKVTAMPTHEEKNAKTASLPPDREKTAPLPFEPGRQARSSRNAGSADLEVRGWREVSAQLRELRTLFHWLLPGMKQSNVFGELAAQDLPPELVLRLLQETAGDEGDERALVRRAALRLVSTGGDVETASDSRTCLALIGPPGAGKTSALVKLTVRLMQQRDRRIGWVNIDNQRITGVEELTVYAGILGVPSEVADSADGLARAIERLSHCNLILIDTPGVCPRDNARLSELAGVLQDQALAGVRRTLVLSAATNWRDLASWTQRYNRIGYDSLLFSMIDACGSFGALFNTVVSCGRPLSYLATSASVTQGITVATPESVVELLLP
jgi:flagellar biosynthesis protein FlhF